MIELMLLKIYRHNLINYIADYYGRVPKDHYMETHKQLLGNILSYGEVFRELMMTEGDIRKMERDLVEEEQPNKNSKKKGEN